MTSTELERYRHVEHVMGTVFSLEIRAAGDWSAPIEAAVAFLHRIDAVFSTYRADSDISRLTRRDLRAGDADPLVAEVLSLCATLYSETGGWFSAIHRGRIDPTGLVKGWAVERASSLLREHGAAPHLINGGGDVQAAGAPPGGTGWCIGVADPRHRGRVLATVTGDDLAVATSGSAERGAHILDPFTGRPATTLLSATVTGPSLTRADVYATACAAMGRQALTWIGTVPGYECLLVAADGTTLTSAGWPGSPC